VRIRKSGCQEELERFVISNGLLTHLNYESTTRLNFLLKQNRLKSRIQFFTDVLKKDPLTELDSKLEISEKVTLRWLENIKTSFNTLS
jgi:hypothetical protein